MEPNLGIEVLANLKGCPTDIPFLCPSCKKTCKESGGKLTTEFANS